MNYNSIEELTKSSHTDFNIIYKYLDSEEIFEFEKEQLLVFQEFEEYFNENFKEEKKKYYEEYNIYNSSKYKKCIADWMLNRIVELDLEDSIEKFYSSNIVNYLKMKAHYMTVKKKI